MYSRDYCFWFCFSPQKIKVGSKALMTLSIMLNTLQVIWQRCTYVVAHFLHMLSCLCGWWKRLFQMLWICWKLFQQQLLLHYWKAWIDHDGIWKIHAHWAFSHHNYMQMWNIHHNQWLMYAFLPLIALPTLKWNATQSWNKNRDATYVLSLYM